MFADPGHILLDAALSNQIQIVPVPVFHPLQLRLAYQHSEPKNFIIMDGFP
jgi:hypothetical protein